MGSYWPECWGGGKYEVVGKMDKLSPRGLIAEFRSLNLFSREPLESFRSRRKIRRRRKRGAVVCWWGLGSLTWHLNIGWLVSLWKEEAGNLARILHYSWWRQWEWIWEGVHVPGCLGGLYLKSTCLLSGLSRVVLSLCWNQKQSPNVTALPGRGDLLLLMKWVQCDIYYLQSKQCPGPHFLSSLARCSFSTLATLPLLGLELSSQWIQHIQKTD